jgi:hypothetical protein
MTNIMVEPLADGTTVELRPVACGNHREAKRNGITLYHMDSATVRACFSLGRDFNQSTIDVMADYVRFGKGPICRLGV